MKQLFYFALFCLISCNGSTVYEVQYHNKTGLKLPKIYTSIDSDSNTFALDVNEKSNIFRMECTSNSWVGPPIISHGIEEYVVKDTTKIYKIGNQDDLNRFDKKKVNLIEIIIDTSITFKDSFFKFKLVE
jgi:hypothetical protein